MIPVTRPFLPPREDYDYYLDGIWHRNWLTNHGPLVNELELSLKKYLDLNYLLFLGNGTIALQIAIKALDLKGEIITTPFSYVATTSSIIWEGCDPVFVDIDPQTLNIDPELIESAITSRTSAILATHVYGNPCDVDMIEEIAQKHNLKIIYDAAHAFGTQYKGRSILSYGDISTLSFHATKLYHTIEGGAVVTNSSDLFKKMAWLRNFGHETPYEFALAGINGKNSEFHAAMGLCNLNHIDEILSTRKTLVDRYNQRLADLPIRHPYINRNTNWNYAYYPILFNDEGVMLRVMATLEKHYVYTRRYFYPSLNTLSYLKSKKYLQVSENIARCILCLPLYHTLSFEEVDMIADIIVKTVNS
jgi:dTDP-4-amino-4,6-dideoxygalactose transaminase